MERSYKNQDFVIVIAGKTKVEREGRIRQVGMVAAEAFPVGELAKKLVEKLVEKLATLERLAPEQVVLKKLAAPEALDKQEGA